MQAPFPLRATWESSLSAHPTIIRRFLQSAALAAALGFGLVACGDVTHPVAEESVPVAHLQGDAVRAGVVAQPLSDDVQFRLTDRWGAPLSGVSVEFRVTEGGGGVVPATTRSDEVGLVRTEWVLGPTAGTQRLELRASGGGPALGSVAAEAEPGPPESVTVVPARVRLKPGAVSRVEAWVQDAFGNPIAAVPADWTLADERVAQVDKEGRLIGLRAGSTEIEATVELVAGAEEAGSFVAGMDEIILPHHRPGHAGGHGNVDVDDDSTEATVQITGGDGQEGEPGERLPEALSIRVTDGQGTPVRRVEVSWNVQAGGGSVNESTTRTDGQGRAEVEWTLGTEPGEYSVTALVADGSLGEATFTGTILDPSSDDSGDGDDTGDGDGNGDGSNDDPDADGVIDISPDTAVLPAIEEELKLEAEVRDADGNRVSTDVAWQSTNPDVVEVKADGRAIARAAGAAFVVASADCCGSDTARIQVEQEPAAIEVSPGSVSLEAGQALTLDASVLDANGHPIQDAEPVWRSSDPEVATVDSDGRVTAQGEGTAEVTATVDDVSASATVQVSEPADDDEGPGQPGDGIWISQSELERLPTSGTAWSNMKSAADTDLRGGVLTDRDDHNVRVMAAALVAARLDDNQYRARVRDALADLMAVSLNNDDGLAVNRRLVAYVVSADLINLSSFDADTDAEFRDWLELVRTTSYQSGGGGTIAEYHERRPNNYGTMAGASRMAVALYLGDSADFERAVQVFRGWLGDRSAYAGFRFGSDLSWQADENAPVGINPRGARKDDRNIDGVLPDDQRRCGSFDSEPWPCTTNYSYGGLAGALAQAQIAHQQGYDAFNWQDRAILRAMTWLHEIADQSADGDREWQPHLVNGVYGTSFPAPSGARPGKNVGWADWTH